MDEDLAQDVVAESSPASGPVVPLSTLSPEQRMEWRKTGLFPAATSTDAPAESSPASTEETPASTDAISETASEPVEDAPAYKTKTAKRIQELLDAQKRANARADELERRLAARDATVAAPSTTAAKDDPEPDAATYDDLTKWMREHARWSAREEMRAASAAHDTTQRTQSAQAEVQRMQGAWSARAALAAEGHADIDTAKLEALIPARSVIDAFVLDLDIEPAAALLRHLHKNPAEIPRLLALSPMRQLADLTRLVDKATAVPKPKLKTSAPDPGPVLGTHVTAGDPVMAALKRGDVRAYRDEMNRREMAKRA